MDDFLSFYKIFKIINIHLKEFIKKKFYFLKALSSKAIVF